MNKTELVAAIAEKAGLSKKDAEGAVKAFTDTVAEQLKAGEKIQLVGFGTFEVAERAARTGKNPQTGEAIKIPASKAPKFKAGKALKDVVNTPAAPAKKSKKKYLIMTFKGCHLCGSLFSLYLIKFMKSRFINYGNRTQVSCVRHP